jgi:hypothetical protein
VDAKKHQLAAGSGELTPPGESPVLVAVLNSPVDLTRALQQGWYRIPLARAPKRVAAEYLALYQTGAFPPDERWLIRWFAPVRAYMIASRRDLIPEEPDHPRVDESYYRVALGRAIRLPRPIPSRRLRRITFIPTTVQRLYEASEINDLWIKSSAQERMWAALKQAELEAERQYPLREELPQYVADFAVFCRNGRIAVVFSDEPEEEAGLRENLTSAQEYLLAAGDWVVVTVGLDEVESQPMRWALRLKEMVAELGGIL